MEVVPVAMNYLSVVPYYPLVVLTVILAAVYYYIETSRIVRLGKKIPGPKTVPFLGNALLTVGVKPSDALQRLLEYDVYGNLTRAFLGTKLFVFMSDPRDIEIILSSSVHIDKSFEYRYFKPWLGDGLLISTGDKWRSHRKIIAPAFHMNILKSFVPFFAENSRDLVKRLRSKVGQEFDCHDYLSAVTVDILLETAMGTRNTKKSKGSYDYAVAVMKMCDIIHRRHYHIFLRFDAFFKFTKFAKDQIRFLNIIHSLTNRVIQEKKEQYLQKGAAEELKEEKRRDGQPETQSAKGAPEKMRYVRDDLDDIDDNDVGEKRRLAFLDQMLECARNGSNLTDEEIKEEVDTIMFEGHDTTAAGSSFVLCLLGIHQDIQARVYEELQEIFKGSDRPCTYQDTIEMKYLERVILETLRLYPPVPAIARKLNEDVKVHTGGHVIPKGCTVIIPQFKVHRLREYYPDPYKFDPDNFLPERMQNRHYYAFIPFSAGPRSCVGRKYAMLKLKVLISTILRNYKILSDLTEKDFHLRVDIILKRDDGFRIKIEPRDKETQEVKA